jgi:NADH-ubiquinone oxidoreductase chain 2
MALVAIIVSVISASYYLKIIRLLHSEVDSNINTENLHINDNKDTNLSQDVQSAFITNFHSFLISTLTLSILLFVLKPSIILNSTQLLSLSLYNF